VRVLIAPDKFKGTLTAAEAADAMAEGWRSIRPQDTVVSTPMADGGTGTLAVLHSALRESDAIPVEIMDAMGQLRTAVWLRMADGRAVIESAQAVGIDLLEAKSLDPLRATSYGVGQLIDAAVRSGASEVVVGLGGSACIDAGAGMAIALGHRLLDAHGASIGLGAECISAVARVEPGPKLKARVVGAVDVESPLLGASGAARMYGPQKGASPKDIRVLERSAAHFATISERDLQAGTHLSRPGAGAAGGLGFGLMAFCGATIRPGAPLVGELVGFEYEVTRADVVLTGEGKLDSQTALGKAPQYVAQRAHDARASVFAIVGSLEPGSERHFTGVLELGANGLENAADEVRRKASDLASSFHDGGVSRS
jgi:glycerate kinase